MDLKTELFESWWESGGSMQVASMKDDARDVWIASWNTLKSHIADTGEKVTPTENCFECHGVGNFGTHHKCVRCNGTGKEPTPPEGG